MGVGWFMREGSDRDDGHRNATERRNRRAGSG